MSRPCWCQQCDGFRRTYGIAKLHEERDRRLINLPSHRVDSGADSLDPEILQSRPVSPHSVVYSEEKCSMRETSSTGSIEDTIEEFVMELLEKQSWGFETQASYTRTIDTISSKAYSGAIDPRFVDGLPNDYRQAKRRYLKDTMQRFYKIPCCVNLCVLFQKDIESLDACPACGEERYVAGRNSRKERQWAYYFGITEWIQRAFNSEVILLLILLLLIIKRLLLHKTYI
jgi:hypothetical protein